MQKLQKFAVLTAMGVLSVAAAGSVPRGVGPEFASHYQSKDSFRCITNPDVEISASRVNDNTCDCPDGSDEPGTAACAHIDPLSPQQPLPGSSSGTTNATHALPGFWCANKGHVGTYVPFLYVNDGICDYDLCCDGTEEYASVGGTTCENRCAAIGKEHRRLAEEKDRKMRDAQTQRAKMIADSAALRMQTESRIVELENAIRVASAEKVALDAKYKELQKKDRNRVVKAGSGGGKLGVLLGQAKTRVNELREVLKNVSDERDQLRDKVNELDTVLRKLKEEYNPNFNDEGVKAAVKSFEDFAAREAEQPDTGDEDVSSVLAEDGEHSGINWAEFESSDDDSDIIYTLDAYLPAFLRDFIQNQKAALRDWLVENGLLAEKQNSASESQATREAREAKENAERDLQKKEQDVENEKTDLAKDYGPSSIFRALKGQCIDIDAGEYTYELCWLDKTSQKSKKGHGNTNMGNFQRIDYETADDEERLDGKSLGKGARMVLRYEDGQACWNGPNRKTDVWLGCSDKEEVWRVTEAEKCVYKMEVGTPAACDEQVEGKAHVKDEL
ncbi:glucosidase 2 subunit beta precursor [Cordyceps militaris CM01]|uniref:Glucosidase 2 subunit beta n=1 Tax=Cordyceps militaris (strain CM01) TaxID=983644 RepID=G3JFK5_CORMM|nr:glucosidase 2 subunit beta precursor [Cordyceps militaris CM01]EGX93579.1 glucosidase 2 subunit beta precursor [Cordyceps militaris CM01]